MNSTSYSLANWNRALVYGLGLSGRAALRLLRKHGIAVVAVDARPAGELELDGIESDTGVELILGSEPTELPKVDGVVVSPGVPLDRGALVKTRQSGIPVIAEVELAAAFAEGPIVGITGSNGKSTTTAMTAALLEASGIQAEVCGNIGRPLSACVEGPPGRVFVVELSSFQLESIVDFRPDAAALLNLSPDHLDRYSSLHTYGAAKLRLFHEQSIDDIAVVNADDPWVAGAVVDARRRAFSRRQKVDDGCFVRGNQVVEVGPLGDEEVLFSSSALRVPGPHNLENAMAASLLAGSVGGKRECYDKAFEQFSGLPHRSEWVASIASVDYYDDSKGTNPGATASALEGFEDGSVHLILGGRAKGGEFETLWERVQAKARCVYLIGEAAQRFESALSGRVATQDCGTLEVAVQKAASQARPGQTVLLSPACSSFDQYENFVVRGEHFHKLVLAVDGRG